MRPPSLAALLFVAACSRGGPPANEAAPAASTPESNAATAPSATQAPAAAPTATDSRTPVKVGALKTFGDWTVGCDNTLACTLASLGAEGADFPLVTIAIVREAGPAGALSVSLDASQDEKGAPARAAIDGKAFDPDTDAAGLVAAMANGQSLSVRDAKNTPIFAQSLKGASAALRYMDAMQGRAGTVTAIVAKGPKPASAVPPAPPTPTILAVKAGGAAALPDAATLKRLSAQAQCEDRPDAGDYWKPEAHALGGGATLVMVPCSAGAYNVSSALFVARGGAIEPATLDAPIGFDATGADHPAIPNVVNGEFHDGTLSDYAKGRGLGDCGSTQDFAWDGARLRLASQQDMGECRGNPNYVTTWRATVVRP